MSLILLLCVIEENRGEREREATAASACLQSYCIVYLLCGGAIRVSRLSPEEAVEMLAAARILQLSIGVLVGSVALRWEKAEVRAAARTLERPIEVLMEPVAVLLEMSIAVALVVSVEERLVMGKRT